MGQGILKNRFELYNLLIILLFLLLWNFIYFIVPLYFLRSDFVLYIPFFGILSYPFWIIIHEAIHSTLFSNLTLNNFFGRILCIYFGAPFRIFQGGHLMHHGYNRTEEEIIDYYDPEKSHKLIAYFKYYFWILGGLYIFEFLSNLIFFIPKKVMITLKEYFKNKSEIKFNYISFLLLYYRQIQFDAFLTMIFYGGIFYLYRENITIILSLLLVRAFIISIMDNVYHYSTEPNIIISGYNLKVPRFLKYMIFNSNFHGFHHLKPKVPWYNLENEFKKSHQKIDGPFFIHLIKQFKGPIAYKK